MSYPVLTVPAGDVIPIMFGTYNSVGASVTMSGLAVTDIEIYKDGSVTQRASDAGYTLLDTDGIDFDGITGIHGFSIDTGDNTDAGFYAVGSWFTVVVSAITVDGQTVSFIAAMFRLVPAEASAGVPDVNVASIDAGAITAAAIATGAIDADALAADAVTEINNGLISVFTDQAFLILESSYGPLINMSVGTTGNDTTHVHLGIDASFGDDEIIDHLIVIRDSSESDSHARWITDYVGATSLATLDSALPFTPTSVGDKYTVFSIRRPHTAAVAAIETDTQDIQSRLPAALVGGRIDATVDGTGMEAGAIDAILQRQITEGYNADGVAPTVEQALMVIMQMLTEMSISGTTMTIKKLDGSTTALTLTLNDSSNPTSITRAT